MKECLRLITERRSITFFDPTKEVPDELIKEILEISATAPSGYNLQPWEVKEKLIPFMLAVGYEDPQRELLPRAYRFKFEEFGRFL
ncbi:MAG: nitroreductase family protein [Thermocrinis sp.]|jgi:nitroreductase|uniref:nitroreductase family protein n=1 Tax=Thermocrinis sp. TaxID=2024383 RepID=UPI003C07581E